LEEIAEVLALVEVDGESNIGDPLVEVVRAFDMKVGDIINQ